MRTLKMERSRLEDSSHYRGPVMAPIVLVGFVDFDCVWCNNAHYMVTRLMERFKNQMKYVFKHFPNTELHKNALTCAMAAEAAYAQGKFWEMHDALFKQQPTLDLKKIKDIAYGLKLDIKQFNKEMENPDKRQAILQDFELGRNFGVTGTPYFFVNGQRHLGDWTYKSLSHRILETAI